jgi:hypothetical protein
MKLLTKEILKKIPALYANEDISDMSKIRVYVKFFFPAGAGSWYGTEYDQETGIFFGFVNLGDDQMAELGSFSLHELESINVRGLRIERDKFWDDKTTLEEVMNFKVR